MRTKPVIVALLALATIAMQGLLTSCAGDENLSTEKPSTGIQTVTLNLKAAGTRAAVYADPGTAAENTINSVTIGIFDKNTGNAVKTIQEVPGSTTPKITTSQLAVDDIVLVAVNAKSGTFTGVKNAADFKNRTLGIDDALGGGSSATTVASSKLPMFGTGTITLDDAATSSYKANVDVYHMVAKVTLNSLSVNFSATGAYKNATFKPTEVFMSNVPDALDFYPASGYSTFATYANLCQGETGKSNLKGYLGTGADLSAFTAKNATLSGVTGAATSNWENTSKILFLYTMPNNATAPTRLVIKGMFAADGNSTNAVPIYYPVNINYNSADGTAAGGTAKQVYPNMNYVIDVTIQGKGSSDPTVPIDPESATANITVKDFTSASQTNAFN